MLILLCEDGAAFTFVFEVKFYPPDVTSLQEDVTRFVIAELMWSKLLRDIQGITPNFNSD